MNKTCGNNASLNDRILWTEYERAENAACGKEKLWAFGS